MGTKRKHRITEELNIALAGIEAGVDMIKSLDHINSLPRTLIESMERHITNARNSLTALQSTLYEL